MLPNDPDSVRVAQIAASTAEADHEMRVAVIPTTAQVEGLAALAVHEPGRTFDQDVLEMTATARHARQGAVTVAAKQAITMAGPCEPGDVLGAIGGDFVVVGHDLTEVAHDVLNRLLGGGGEMVTLVSGADDEGGALAQACERLARGAAPDCRRRGVRRWPGALPAPRRRRVGSRSSDRPRLSRRVGARRREGQEGPVPQRGHHRAARHRDRRRPAAPLPAPLPRDRLALHARGARGGPADHGGRRDLVARRAGPTRTAAPAASAYRQEVVLRTEGPSLQMTFFAQQAHDRPLTTSSGSRVGRRGIFMGKVGTFRGDWQLTNPQMVLFGADGESSEDLAALSLETIGPLYPLYPATKDVESWDLQKAISFARSMVDEVPELLPEPVHGRVRRARRAHRARPDPRPRDLGPDHEGPAPLPVRGGPGHPARPRPEPPRRAPDGREATDRRGRRAAGGVRRAAAVGAHRRPGARSASRSSATSPSRTR